MKEKFYFTLLELLIVVVIIGILTTIFVPLLSSSREDSRRTACKSHLRSLFIGFKLYADDSRGYYPQGLESTATNTLSQDVGYISLHQKDILRTPKVYKCPSRSSHDVSDDVYNEGDADGGISSLGVGQNECNLSYPYIPSLLGGDITNLHSSKYGTETALIRDKTLNHNFEFGNVLFGSGRVESFQAVAYDSSNSNTSWLFQVNTNFWSNNPRANAILD